MPDKVTYLSSRVQEATSGVRATPGGSLLYAIEGLNITGDGSRSDTVELTLEEDLPLFMLACLAVEGGGASDGYSLFFNLNGTRLVDFPHTGIGDNETIGTKNVSVVQSPGIGTHEIYAELVEDTINTSVYGEWSGFVIVGSEGTGEITGEE